jgi:hypothetical protein
MAYRCSHRSGLLASWSPLKIEQGLGHCHQNHRNVNVAQMMDLTQGLKSITCATLTDLSSDHG